MEIIDKSNGSAEISIVVCLHGDETGPKQGIKQLLAEKELIDAPVKCVIANTEAVRQGVRYVDEDLNRSFSGTENRDTHESRLAPQVLNEVKGTKVLDLHTTYSYEEPFIIIGQVNPTVKELAAATALDKVVDQSNYASGGLIQCIDGISIECGLKGDQATISNAYEITKRVLRFYGVLSGQITPSDEITKWILRYYRVLSGQVTLSDPIVYEVYDTIPRPSDEDIRHCLDKHLLSWSGVIQCLIQSTKNILVGKLLGTDIDIIAENFTKVNRGDVICWKNGNRLTANETFWPVLLSNVGYNKILGYKSIRRGPLSVYEFSHP